MSEISVNILKYIYICLWDLDSNGNMDIRLDVVCVLLGCFAATNARFFKFEDCSKKDSVAEGATLKISPDPVDIGKDISVNLFARLLTDLPPDAVLKTQIYKLKSILGFTIPLPIPCVYGKFGSCTLPVCEYLDIFREQVKPFFPPDRKYGCPVLAGKYSGQDVRIHIPPMNSVTRSLFSGRYTTELTVFDRRGGKELACYKVHSELN